MRSRLLVSHFRSGINPFFPKVNVGKDTKSTLQSFTITCKVSDVTFRGIQWNFFPW